VSSQKANRLTLVRLLFFFADLKKKLKEAKLKTQNDVLKKENVFA